MICANRHIKDAYNDLPIERPPIDVGREQRWSPRTRQEVDLALAAIKKLYQFIDGLNEWALSDAKRYCDRLLQISPYRSIRSLADGL